jgi:hypothetical protein
VASASTWADAGLVLLLIVALGPGLVLLLLAAGLAAGLWYTIRWLPAPLARGRAYIDRSTAAAQRAAELAVRPVVVPSAAWSAMVALLRILASIFRSSGVGSDEP